MTITHQRPLKLIKVYQSQTLLHKSEPKSQLGPFPLKSIVKFTEIVCSLIISPNDYRGASNAPPKRETIKDEGEFMIFLIKSLTRGPPRKNNQRTIKRCADSVWLNCLIFTRFSLCSSVDVFNLFS